MKNVEYAESEHQNQFYFNKGISSKIKIVRSFFSQLAQLDCSKDFHSVQLIVKLNAELAVYSFFYISSKHTETHFYGHKLIVKLLFFSR